jgi:hypothetical protein
MQYSFLFNDKEIQLLNQKFDMSVPEKIHQMVTKDTGLSIDQIKQCFYKPDLIKFKIGEYEFQVEFVHS